MLTAKAVDIPHFLLKSCKTTRTKKAKIPMESLLFNFLNYVMTPQPFYAYPGTTKLHAATFHDIICLNKHKFLRPLRKKNLGEPMIKNIANIVTGYRILGSVLLLFFPAFSVGFYLLYITCGFSDMIDGTIARKTNSTSVLGAKIDTAADFVFVAVSLIKILPTITIPQWLWIWGVVIAMLKIGNILWGYASKKQFMSLHTISNKITGLLLFLLPLTLSWVNLKYTFVAVCSVATFAAIQECFYVVTNRVTFIGSASP